jgi:RHS repeat-associated protein
MFSSRSLIAGLVALLGTQAHAERPVAGAVTSDRLKLPSGPSSVRGLADEPAVDAFYAQVNYEVPIELPSGFGGLAPQLALTYSGALGNGPMGIGWSLTQTKIERSTRLGVPAFDDTDELVISGVASGRLVAIGGNEYRVEGMGQTVRVKRVGAGWEVDSGTGVHYRLGVSPSARQESDATHTVAWLVETQTNQMGETIRFDYIRDLGQLYPSALAWGPNDCYRAALVYEPRTDVTRSYRDGFLVTTAKRLKSIAVTAFGVEKRAYGLAYDATFQVARLAGVTSTGVAGTGAWPALTFSYATPNAPVISPIAGVGTWRLNSSGTTLVDLDGDGAAELLQLAGTGHAYLTNQRGTFGAMQPMSGNSLSITSQQLQDIDGDGRVDLIQDTGTGWSVWKFARTQWVPQTGTWPGTPGLALKNAATTRFADLDGDGLVDAIQWDNDNLKVHWASRTGFGAEVVMPRIGGTIVPTAPGRFLDANGDGLDDYVVLTSDRTERYIGRGNGTFEPMAVVAYPFAGQVARPEDIELADLDRDGLLDLVRVDQGSVSLYRGKPQGGWVTAAVTLANPEPLSATVVVAIADTNGNGSQDVVWSSTSGMWRMDLAGTTTAGMLAHVKNGLGMDTAFEYKSSHELSADARSALDPWAVELPISMPVPVKKTTELGPGEATRRISYSVRDGFWDALEQRFGGFRTTTVTTAGATAAETSTVITRYHSGTGANRVLRGRAVQEQTKDGTGKRLALTTSTWEAMPIAGLPDLPLLRRAVLREAKSRYEDVTPIREADVTHAYDALGRRTRTVDAGRLDLTGDESVHEQRYADDDTTWVRDQLCEETVTDLAGVIASRSQHLFGDHLAVQPLCTVGKGWARETRAWLATRFVTTAATSYDVHGNPTSTMANGVTRSIDYDADGLFPVAERMTVRTGRVLVWTAIWDRVLGVLTDVTDPNGHTTHASYDTLGRYTGTAIDARPRHQVIEYDLTLPYPKTLIWDYDGTALTLGAKPTAWTPTGKWRQRVEVLNGAGDVRYRALRAATAQWIISEYHERDAASRVVFVGRPVTAAALELAARPVGVVGDALVYDPLGRLIEQRLPTGAKRTFSFVAFERTMTESDLAPVHSVLDGQGRAVLTERQLADGTLERVQASYDAAGRVTQMTLAGGVVRTFKYDTIGRLIESRDPDLGTRTLVWNDGNRLASETNAAGQTTTYDYDAGGRLTTKTAGAVYRFHYDDPRVGAAGVTNAAARLAWIEEPTGGIDVGYDETGRTIMTRRQIDARVSESRTAYAASELVLQRSFDDGLALDYRYDPAGRLTAIGDLWQVLDQDASGRPLHERTSTGVDTVWQRDALGLASRVTVRDSAGQAIYDVGATRNAWTAITDVADFDGVGLDQSAHFDYDRFARLTGARIGEFQFGYRYDGLHNMTSRTATGPRAIGAMFGTYRYGEAGHAPRQLTSIVDAAGVVTHQFDYDAAGRQTTEDGRTMTYDPADRLLRVDGVAGGAVVHAYGHDGGRVKTTAPDGTVEYFFGDGVADRGGVREHDVSVGDRIVARIEVSPAAVAGDEDTNAASGVIGWGIGIGGGALALCALLIVVPKTRRRLVWAMVTIVAPSCTPGASTGTTRQHATIQHAMFMHTGFGAGPLVFTDATGHLAEERRHEPYGAFVDASNLVARDVDPLNQRRDAASGWSDHGARWLAPETARWLTPDPPVEGPTVAQMAEPWSLHPYQFVDGNPVAYWDPDGREPAGVGAYVRIVQRAHDSLDPHHTSRVGPNLAAMSTEELQANRDRRTYEGMTHAAAMGNRGLWFVFTGPGAATVDTSVGIQAEATAFIADTGVTAGVNYQVFMGKEGTATGLYTQWSTDVNGTFGVSVSGGINVGMKVTSYDDWRASQGAGQGGKAQWPGVFHQVAVSCGPVTVGGYAADGITETNGWVGVSVEGGVGWPVASAQVSDVDYQPVVKEAR